MDERRRADGPAVRLLRLWLWAAPAAMLGVSLVFAVLAAVDGDWALLAVMVALAVVAVVLLVAHWRMLRRLSSPHQKDDGGSNG